MHLVFFGETLEGFEREAVKNRLGQLLKLDDAARQKLFSGARMVLKQSIDEAEATRYTANFAKIGARLHMEPVGGPVRTAPAAPAVTPAAASAVLASAPPLAPAEEQVTCPNCGERQSKRILCRSCSTDIPMALAAKEEARREEREARLAESRARRGEGRTSDSGASGDQPAVFGVGLSGRMARLPYSTACGWAFAALVLVGVFVIQKPSGGRVGIFLVMLLLSLLLMLRWGALRCHDCNRSGFWILLTFVPYLGFVAQLVVSFMPGTHGDNDHGSPARSGSWAKLALSVVAVSLSLVLLAKSNWEVLALGHLQSVTESEDGQPLEVPGTLTSAAARAAFSGPYAEGQNHKAFAVSSSGSWGWKAGAASPRGAVQEAIANCEAERAAYTAPCELINVNGQSITMPTR